MRSDYEKDWGTGKDPSIGPSDFDSARAAVSVIWEGGNSLLDPNGLTN
jgi:hypothetical protein